MSRLRIFPDSDPSRIELVSHQHAQIAAELGRIGVRFELLSFPGAKHGFTNPKADQLGERFEMPLAYDADADNITVFVSTRVATVVEYRNRPAPSR